MCNRSHDCKYDHMLLKKSKKKKHNKKKKQNSCCGPKTTAVSIQRFPVADFDNMHIVSHEEKRKQRFEETDVYKLRVKIVKMVFPDLIYVALYASEASYQKMMGKMKEFYETNRSKEPVNLENNKYYAVYSVKDKQYCRAQFIEMMSDSYAKMSMIDLAEEQIVEVNKIEPLVHKFTMINKYLFKVKLAGIRPCGGDKWLKSSIEKLRTIIEDESGDGKFYIEKIVSNF